MSAKHNPCTSKWLVMLGVLFCAHHTLPGQNPWREGRNVAGVAVSEDIGRQAHAWMLGTYASGGFRTPSIGKTLLSAGAGASAETRDKDLLLQGNFGFELEHSTQACGSMFTSPGYFPLDIVEFTPGTKLRQRYDIGGALAWKNSSDFTPGASVRFRGINYAKRKDLRHTSWRQEFELAPSLAYKGDSWKAGISIIARKISEFIKAEQIGEAPKEPYMAFLDKGLRYGTLQEWEGSGLFLKGTATGVDRLPVKEFAYGAALQVQAGASLYAQVEYLYSRGELGEKGYVWFNFPGHSVEAQLFWNHRSPGGEHRLGLGYHWTALQNRESVLEQVSNAGIIIPVIYAHNTIYRQKTFSAGPSWLYKRHDEKEFSAAVRFENDHRRSTLMYPYMDLDQSLVMLAEGGAELPLGSFLLRVHGLFGCKVKEHGHVVEKADASLGVSSTPFRLKEWWDMEQEYNDATRVGLSLALRYNFTLGRAPLYAEGGLDMTKAFGIQLLEGSSRLTSSIKFGYNF